MSKINNLEELLVEQLKDLYSAETQLIKALPKLADAATNSELKEAFSSHLLETRGHAERLEQALEILGESEGGKTCQAMKGLVEEGSDAIKANAPAAVRDADLIAAAQRVEHYEIAAYGSARAFAEKLDKQDIANLLQMTLKEEAAADKKLTAISESVNEEAFEAAAS
jgi:ferritin-like metal-binding protein YciE